MRDNTVGSLSALTTLITNNESAYILGLWCADGYFWSSSIGITSVDQKLIDRFSAYFATLLPKERQKIRVYYPVGQKPRNSGPSTYTMRLAKQVAYQLYVNSRPLLRLFQQAEKEVLALEPKYIMAYFAGRFDGDGCINPNLRNDLRISYSNQAEAETDQSLLHRLGVYKTRVYRYRTSMTYVLYVSRYNAYQFIQAIAPFSVKAQSLLPRRDLVALSRTSG